MSKRSSLLGLIVLMAVVKLTDNIFVGEGFPCFIVAEIGQNHQGNIDTAKRLIDIAKKCGADCVKFQKSCLSDRFTKSALARPYLSEHSWGETYEKHKEYLEFSTDEYRDLQNYACEVGIMFSASGMDPCSIDILHSMDVPFIKIGSGDADNLVMIKKAAKLHKPLFISTGMQDLPSVKLIYETVTETHNQVVLLHCVSAYPTPVEAVNLRVIQMYKTMFSDIPIGYSGHELGITISVAAVSLGAKVIERHVTLDKTWKGSDHKCSLEPDELRQMVFDIRQVEMALGSPIKQYLPCEYPCKMKLSKSIVAAYDLHSDTVLTEKHINIKVSDPLGDSCIHFHLFLGKKLNKNIFKDYPITFSDIC